MTPIIHLLFALVVTISLRVIAMDTIMKKEDCYMHDIESFRIDINKTANILTFYLEDDKEVAYLDYELDKATQIAFIRMFICDEADEAAKKFFFLIAEKGISEEKNIKNIWWFINKNEIDFYQPFGATVDKSQDGHLCMQLACGKAYSNISDYYRKNTQQDITHASS